MSDHEVSQSGADQAAFYSSWGRALAAWQEVEQAMYYCCHLALGIESRLSAAVFYQFRTGEQKISILDRLMQIKVSSADQNDWASLRKQLFSGNTDRNELAHWKTVTLGRDDHVERGGIHLSENWHALRAKGKPEAFLLDGVDLGLAESRFLMLASDQMRFSARHFDLKGLQQEPFPPGLRELHEKLLQVPESLIVL